MGLIKHLIVGVFTILSLLMVQVTSAYTLSNSDTVKIQQATQAIIHLIETEPTLNLEKSVLIMQRFAHKTSNERVKTILTALITNLEQHYHTPTQIKQNRTFKPKLQTDTHKKQAKKIQPTQQSRLLGSRTKKTKTGSNKGPRSHKKFQRTIGKKFIK